MKRWMLLAAAALVIAVIALYLARPAGKTAPAPAAVAPAPTAPAVSTPSTRPPSLPT
jgi:hypothetical protein